MLMAAKNRVACERYLCFVSDRRGRKRLQLGTNMIVLEPGWGPSDKMPAIAASAAAMVQS